MFLKTPARPSSLLFCFLFSVSVSHPPIFLLEFQRPRKHQCGARTWRDTGHEGAWRASRRVEVGIRNHAAGHRIQPHSSTPKSGSPGRRRRAVAEPRPGTARAGACPLRVRPAEAGTCTAQGGEGSGRLKPEKTQTSSTAGGPDRLWNPHGELRHAAEARGDITVAAAGVTLA